MLVILQLTVGKNLTNLTRLHHKSFCIISKASTEEPQVRRHKHCSMSLRRVTGRLSKLNPTPQSLPASARRARKPRQSLSQKVGASTKTKSTSLAIHRRNSNAAKPKQLGESFKEPVLLSAPNPPRSLSIASTPACCQQPLQPCQGTSHLQLLSSLPSEDPLVLSADH
jgi:hypothetical protein